MRFLVYCLILFSLLPAMGEKPGEKKTSKKETSVTKKVSEKKIVEDTAEKQFKRAYQEYLRAQKINYPKYREIAIESFDNYLKFYPRGDKRLDALFYLEKLHLLNNDRAKQQEYLDIYYSEAPSDNFYIVYADLDRAELLARANNLTGAAELLEQLTTTANLKDETIKQELHRQKISLHERTGNKEELKKGYLFFINNKQYLKNKNIYYVYCYKLAEIYAAEGNTAEAKKYYNIVVKAQDFNTTYLKDLAAKNLKKL